MTFLTSLRISLFITLNCLRDPDFYSDTLRMLKRFSYILRKHPVPQHLLHPFTPTIAQSDPALSENIPVDLVYSWVDGSDPEFKASVIQLAKDTGAEMSETIYDMRYIQHDELKLSLRSVEKFMPWVNRIYIVTNGQVPEWLDTSHPKIQIVTHKELFPDEACMPNFNSNSIEFQLHRIPGLSEHFIYACDDNFLGMPVTKEDFFTFDAGGNIMASKPRIRLTAYILPPLLYTHTFRKTWANLRYRLERDYPGHKANRLLLHQTIPLCKSLIEQTIAAYPDIYKDMSHTRIRLKTDIPTIGFFCHYANIHGRITQTSISEYYSNTMSNIIAYLRQKTVKLLGLNIVDMPGDICDHFAAIDFCTSPSAFEKKAVD